MGLRVDWNGVEGGFESVSIEGTAEPEISAIVLLMIPMGVQQITEANAASTFARLKMLDRLAGGMMVGPGGAWRPFEPEDVRRLIGVSANISPKTDKQFLRGLDFELEKFAAEYERVTARAEDPVK